jgi:hypothetical protein
VKKRALLKAQILVETKWRAKKTPFFMNRF